MAKRAAAGPPLVTVRVESYPKYPQAKATRFICVGPYVLTPAEAQELVDQITAALGPEEKKIT